MNLGIFFTTALAFQCPTCKIGATPEECKKGAVELTECDPLLYGDNPRCALYEWSAPTAEIPLMRYDFTCEPCSSPVVASWEDQFCPDQRKLGEICGVTTCNTSGCKPKGIKAKQGRSVHFSRSTQDVHEAPKARVPEGSGGSNPPI